jgi:hypothetical protein
MSTKIKSFVLVLVVVNLIFLFLFFNIYESYSEYKVLFESKENEFLQLCSKYDDLKKDSANRTTELTTLKLKVAELEGVLKDTNSYKGYREKQKSLVYNEFKNFSLQNNVAGQMGRLYKIGAICMDGWRSETPGKGACSHHGGVRYWIYNDGSFISYTK